MEWSQNHPLNDYLHASAAKVSYAHIRGLIQNHQRDILISLLGLFQDFRWL